MQSAINIIFPNQLFKKSFILDNNCTTYLIEEFLFFNHYNFHKQKIAYHRSSMKKYYDYLVSKGIKVIYIDSYDKKSDIRHFLSQLDKSINEINIYNPVDTWLLKRIQSNVNNRIVNIKKTPLFISTNEDLKQFFRVDKKSFSHAVFYKQQRNKLNILMNDTNQPFGGKYSFDADNRKKYPSKKVPPKIPTFKSDTYWDKAKIYTQKYFTSNPGHLSDVPLYPNDHNLSNKWFDDFLINRFKEFGDYEDAIVNDEVFLNHSVLTPMLNSGLILPEEIITKTLKFTKENDIPLNSLEGFIRQIIGWREFIRGMYVAKGTYSRNLNFWKYKRKIPQSFYDGTTGSLPVDDAIKKLLETGYSHHIDRLMVIGNFMLLCQFDPNDVYKWFMELYVDAYDWVMVPNVYGMSQFSDGGLFATKPYISSSNYIKKMSNYKNGPWCETWDGLYWNFISNESKFFSSNPRLSMMIRIYDKMGHDKKNLHKKNAKNFLKSFKL